MNTNIPEAKISFNEHAEILKILSKPVFQGKNANKTKRFVSGPLPEILSPHTEAVFSTKKETARSLSQKMHIQFLFFAQH